jgi:hypothetical protein
LKESEREELNYPVEKKKESKVKRLIQAPGGRKEKGKKKGMKHNWTLCFI